MPVLRIVAPAASMPWQLDHLSQVLPSGTKSSMDSRR